MVSCMKRPLKKHKRIVIGLTGGFGTGKTTVARMLREYGARIIDADAVGHALLVPGTRVYRALVKRFGLRVLRQDLSIDRSVLSHIVFSDESQLRALNHIIHPEIIRIINSEISKARKGVVVLDAPLLVEAGLHRNVDKLVVVTASRVCQVKRLQKRTSLSKAAIVRRAAAQIPLTQKVRMADFVIDNNGTRKDLRKQVMELRRMWWIS
jgi:dephospho-CoA kinase